jgi:hypothetical protein
MDKSKYLCGQTDFKNFEWRYIKPLLSVKSIEEFEALTKYNLPESFKNCIKQYNGARPKYRAFNTAQTNSRELKSLLSFNHEDKETVWVSYCFIESECDKKCIPFAIDNFGNLICFNRNDQVVFLNHETLNEEYVASSFDEFLDSLYIKAGYWKDYDRGTIVRNIKGYGVEYFEKDNKTWINCGPNSNYYREIFIGEGNNCLRSITEEDVSRIII